MATNGNPLAFPTGQDYQSSRSDEFQQLEARPYRSKKRRPCDHCRRRRVGCFVDHGQVDCTLCRHRSTKCTFLSVPPVKKRRSLGENGDQAKQDPGIGSKLAGLQRVHKLAKQHTEAASISDSSERLRTTVIPGRTFLYTGASSDQDVYLLRHLPFRGKSAFGTANWTVWKALAREFGPAYFTSYPDHLLDAREGAYELDHVKNLVEPNHSVLLSIYYSHFHPSLPILEDLIAFEELLSANKIPASLLAAVYCAALDFQPGVDVALKQELRELVFLGVTYEARTPSLRTVQANLIYLQIAPMLVREPNHPGYWPLTSQLVAVSQEIGLHANPEAWDLSSAERKSRRILWWTVYMQDKWLAHWYGRPSHIHENQFDLTHLADTDFTNDVGGLNEGHLSSVVAFISLTKLSVVLASVLDNFYTVKDSADRLSAEQALQRASKCQAQLTTWYTENAQIWEQPGSVINNYAVIFAYYGIAVSIQRALFTCVGGTSYYDIHRESALFREIFEVFERLLTQDLSGLWLSYCKSNIAILGSFLITALLSSTNDAVYETRQGMLETYSYYLRRLAQKFEFARLPELRLNLLLERFSTNQNDVEFDAGR